MKTVSTNGFSGLPTLQMINDHIHTMEFGELVERLYPGETFDTDMPLEWVNACRKKGLDPRRQCVWLYRKDKGFILGEPAAVTHDFFMAYREAFDVFPVCPVALRTED